MHGSDLSKFLDSKVCWIKNLIERVICIIPEVILRIILIIKVFAKILDLSD
jgi:hypothetical protein